MYISSSEGEEEAVKPEEMRWGRTSNQRRQVGEKSYFSACGISIQNQGQ